MRFDRRTEGEVAEIGGFVRSHLLSAAALAALLALCCVSGSTASPATKKAALPVLRIGLSGDVTGDPSKGASLGTADLVYSLAYAPLFHMKPDGSVVPALATSWRYLKSKAGTAKEFEFTLRHDAKFSDGTPVTAPAVASWMGYFAAAGGPFSTLLGPKPRFSYVGRWRVRMILTVPTPNLPSVLSDVGQNWGYVVSPQAVQNTALLATSTDGAGPYMLDPSQTVRGDHYTYVPNPNYYDKSAIKFSQVDIKVVPTPSSMLEAIQSGQFDVVSGDLTTSTAAASAGLQVVSGQAFFMLTALDTGRLVPALGDVRVRQALNYAIDRKTITKALFGTTGTPTAEWIPGDADPGLENAYPYDPQKAKSLLAAAGYPNGFKLTVLGQSYGGVLGDPLDQAIATDWEAVGVQVDLQEAPNVGDWLTKAASKTYPAFIFSTSINTTTSRYASYISPKAVYHLFGDDPTVDKLYYAGLHAANSTSDWKQMWTRINQQAYFVPITTYPMLYYVTKSIKGVVAPSKRFATPLVSEWSPA